MQSATFPGAVTQIAGFKATVCQPSASAAIRRIIVGAQDLDVASAETARDVFATTIEALIKRLRPKDFEVIIDLILQRTGWVRIARLGGSTEGIDIEAENPATGEIAFVQIKSRANQGIIDDYVGRFQARRERYALMIFAVHTVYGQPLEIAGGGVHIWNGPRVADLVVTLGLSDWLARRV